MIDKIYNLDEILKIYNFNNTTDIYERRVNPKE